MEPVTKSLPAVEGLTPTVLWYTLVGIVGICTLIILWDKVSEVFRKRKQRQRDEQQLEGQDITDRIAAKVEQKLEPRFEEINKKFRDIDQKLSNDKENIELHTRQLNAYESRVKRLETGNNALCHGVFALLSHQIDGNSIDKLKRSYDGMHNYLIDGEYREEN